MAEGQSGVPVRWLLGQRPLDLHLVAGGRGVNAEITFVVTSELRTPGDWLAGDEAVLTTGITLPADAAGRRQYIRDLHESGAAAVGFGFGLTHDAVPAELVAAAEECGLALFTVPLPTPFVAVARTVIDRIAELQYEAVISASRAQPRLTRAMLGGGRRR